MQRAVSQRTLLAVAEACVALTCLTSAAAFAVHSHSPALTAHHPLRSSLALSAACHRGHRGPLCTRTAHPSPRPAAIALRMQEQDAEDTQPDEFSVSTAAATAPSESWMPTVSSFQYAWLLAILPALSAVFPAIVTAAQDATVPEDRRFLVILFLLLKRIYLYSCALSIVDVAARRSVGAPAALGQRIQSLNKELLGGVVSAPELARLSDSQEAQEMYGQMDKVDSGTQALLLPLFLAVVLASSYFAIQLFSQAPPPPPDSSLSLEPIFRSVSAVSNAGICLLFTRAELLEALRTLPRALNLPGAHPKQDGLAKLALGLSAVAVGGSFLGPPQFVWPLRNVVNSCLAITVARAVQLPRLSFVVAALGGLMLYDGIGVNGGPLMALPANAESAAPSVMEKVARAKLAGAGGGWWQPGLLSVVVGGQTTDALGLGDTVFPAILAGWAIRHDQRPPPHHQDPPPPPDPAALPKASWYSRAALGGYAVGCFGMEVFQGGGGGQAALLYIVPCMLGATLATAAARGELTNRIWEAP